MPKKNEYLPSQSITIVFFGGLEIGITLSGLICRMHYELESHSVNIPSNDELGIFHKAAGIGDNSTGYRPRRHKGFKVGFAQRTLCLRVMLGNMPLAKLVELRLAN